MPEKIRILFAIGSLGGGGAERALVDQMKRIDRSRFIPALYLVENQGEFLSELPDDVPLFAFSDRQQLPVVNWPGRIHGQLVKDMAAVIQEQKIDIVFDQTFHMTLIAGPATEKTSTARVSLVVCDPESNFINNETRFQRLKRRALKHAYQTADKVVAVSDGVRNAVINFFDVDPANIITHYYSIDFDRIDRLAAHADVQLQPGLFHVVSCGRLHDQKGYPYLIEAADQLIHREGYQDLRFHILGEGPRRDELTAMIQEKQLTEHIILAGFQSNPFQFYRQAQLFCFPSLYEGMPNALLEALASKIPVVSADCPSGPREILDDGKYGRLVPIRDSSALAAAIADAVRHHEQWQSIVPAARQRIEELFGYEQGMQQLEEILIDATAR